MAVDPENLRLAMRKWATGVTVLTTEYQGVIHGMTVNSFTSISLEPPLVLASLEKSTRTHGLVEKSGIFSVTILSEDQQEVSDCFAGRLSDKENRFENTDTFTLETGAPFISGGLAGVDCRVVASYEAGTHTLFIGEVVAVWISDHPSPLLYYNRSYRRFHDS